MALDKFYLVFLVSVVAEACTGGGAHDEYRVIRKTDSDGKQVPISQKIKFSIIGRQNLN